MRKVEGLEFLADEASASPGTRAILDARTRYEQAERNLDAVRDDLTARNAAYRRLSGIAPPTTAELRNLAEQHPDTLYLEWAIGAEATSLQFALSKQDGVKAFVLDTGEEALRKQVHAWREAIHKEDSQAEIAAAQSLYTTLFASVEKAGLLKPEKFARLVLVGDGPLLEMPFAALCDSEGKRLVERMPLAVSGSFGVLTWPDGKSRGEGAPLIAAAPSSPGAPPLPGARKEGQAIARLLSGSELLVGEAVTKERVVERLADASLLHFATHGLLDREDGLGCGLLMASQKGGDDLEVLEARELISMRIGAQMAVLSACDTGEGQNSGGEGLLGLTWAFRAAGCPSIAATLWSVEDESAGQLMTRFYTELRSGMRKDEAMRKAMLAVKAAHPAPFYWAAFQLYGETSPLSQ
jgi:CHAT domain-containing protein